MSGKGDPTWGLVVVDDRGVCQWGYGEEKGVNE